VTPVGSIVIAARKRAGSGGLMAWPDNMMRAACDWH
jgi:hypothetical protein